MDATSFSDAVRREMLDLYSFKYKRMHTTRSLPFQLQIAVHELCDLLYLRLVNDVAGRFVGSDDMPVSLPPSPPPSPPSSAGRRPNAFLKRHTPAKSAQRKSSFGDSTTPSSARVQLPGPASLPPPSSTPVKISTILARAVACIRTICAYLGSSLVSLASPLRLLLLRVDVRKAAACMLRGLRTLPSALLETLKGLPVATVMIHIIDARGVQAEGGVHAWLRLGQQEARTHSASGFAE